MTANRRIFLAAAGGSLFAAGDSVRIGVIGLGGRGNALLTTAASTPGVRITHLCEIDQSRLERAKQSASKLGQGNVRGSADMRRVFEDKEVDAVIIATPDHWHAPAAILACDAGKDVYVEKPISHNLREGRLLVEAARRNKRVVQAGLQSRSRTAVRRGIELAHTGKLGRVLMAKAWNVQLRKNIGRGKDAPVPPGVDYDLWVGPALMVPFRTNRFHYDWHWDWNFGTGDMGNDGAHQIDIARWALGEGAPTRVSGSAAKYYFDDDQQTPDTMNMTFDYGGKKGLIWEMRIWNSYMMEGIDNAVSVYGSDAMMQIGDWDRKWGYRIFDRKGVLAEEFTLAEPETHIKNFAECVLTRAKPNCEVEEGHLSCVHCHLGNIVARTGRNLTYNTANETIPGDTEANGLIRRKYRNHWATPKGV